VRTSRPRGGNAEANGEVLRLEDDKRELEKRIAHYQREVEQLRAKIPRGMSTS